MPRQRPFLLALVLLVLILILALAAPVSLRAQGDPTPIPVPGATEDPLVIGLPFGDTFDSDQGWTPAGAWSFDTDTAYSGAGWWVDGSQRQMVSTLDYQGLLDLSGALSAQLVFRQKGYLPPSDLIAVDLSLNGGLTWIAVDQQIGLDTDWTLRVVDLTRYRGQVVQIRFRVNTGLPLPQDAAEAPPVPGYWIDNLNIQFVLEAPVLAFTPADGGPRTLMGLHLVVGARKEPVLDLVKRLREIGWPLGTLKGTTGTEDILNEVTGISPETVIVFRSLDTPEGRVDCPNVANDPTLEAQIWITGMQQYWRRVAADYYEIMNECHPPTEWLVPFSIEAMKQAGAQGECLLLFSFGPGNPEADYFNRLLPVFDYAVQNPCQPGRYHGIALHAYGISPGMLVSESGIYLGFRHRLLMGQILPQLPGAIQLPVYLTEAGAGDGRTGFRCEDITRDVIQYTQQLEYDPYVRGFHLWNLGPQNSPQWIDVTPCLSMIGDALVNYYAGR